MPELAEVEVGRKLAERVAVGRTIARAHVEPDPIVFDHVPPEEVRAALEGARVLAAHRRGKQLWWTLDRSPSPLFHFGMTGAFRSPVEAPLPLESKIKDPEGTWPPRFTKLHLWLDDGGELVMTNARRLGRIRLRENPLNEPPLSQLGFDPLTDLPDPETFRSLVRRRKVPLKALLLDQGFAAGVGNWLADEIAYQARIDPRRRPPELSDAEIETVRGAMRDIVAHAVAVDADKSRFPSSWLFHQRWGKKEGAETEDGHPIEHLTLGGRTTAWVPAVQR